MLSLNRCFLPVILGISFLAGEELPMGKLGGTLDVSPGSNVLVVKSLTGGAPGQVAGLQTGDIIIGAEGQSFSETPANNNDGYQGALVDLATAMEFAASQDGLLDLEIVRSGVGGVSVTADIGTTALGPVWPGTSAKGNSIFEEACAEIHQQVQGSGSDNFGYNTGWYGLILLSHPDWNSTSGAKPYRNSINQLRTRCENFLNGRILEPLEPYYFDGTDVVSDPNFTSPGLENWDICSSAIFLSLYRSKTGDTSANAVVQRAATMIAHRIQSWDQYDDPGLPHVLGGGLGRMGHGGVAGDYSHYNGIGALNIINAHALTALGLLKNAGADMSVNLGRSPNSKSYDSLQLTPTIEDKFRYCWDYVKAATTVNGSADDGNVGYVGRQSGWDSSGRTPGSIAGWQIYGLAPTADDSDKLARQSAYVARRWYRQQHCHAYTLGGVVLSQLSMPFLEDRQERYFQENTRLYATLTQEPDDSIAYVPGRQNNGGDGYLNKSRVALINAAMPSAIASGNLPGFPARNANRFHAALTSHLSLWKTIEARSVRLQGLTHSLDFDIVAENGSVIAPASYSASWSQTQGSTANLTPNGASLDVTFPSKGSYQLELDVTHGGETITEVYNVEVVNPPAAPVAPYFITQPQSEMVSQGEPVTLTVTAQGSGPLLFQWFLNGTALGLPSPERELSIASASAGSAGDYTCQVTNAAGTATSNIATITIEGVGEFVIGGLWQDLFYGIPGSAITDLTSATAYPAQPDASGPISGGEAPSDAGSDYGQRWSGWITPPETGSYRLYIAADDTSQLWLSTDDTRANRVLIASTPNWTDSRQWNKFSSQRSSNISLVGGQRYFIEVLHKEGGGGDNLAITWNWQSAGTWATPANGSAPLPGARLEYQVGGTLDDNVTPPSNYNPIANANTLLVYGGSETTLELTGYDPEGQPVTYTITANPTKGSLTGTEPNLVYIPFPGESGTDEVRFTVNDGTSDSSEAVITISLVPEGAGSVMVWDGSSSIDWATASNWVANRTVVASDAVLFDDRSLANLATNLPAGQTVSRLIVEDPVGDVSIGGQSLTIDNGIEMRPATHDLTLDSDLVLGGSQEWSVGPNRSLTVNGALAGSGGVVLTKGGAGTLTFTSPSSFSGGIIVQDGHLNIQGGGWFQGSVGGTGPVTILSGASATNVNAHSFGSGNNANRDLVIDGGSFYIDGETYFDDLSMTGGLIANSAGSSKNFRTRSPNGTIITINGATESALISCPLAILGTATITTLGGSAWPDLRVSGLLESGADLTKNGPGELEISSTSSHTGSLAVTDGTLIVTGSLAAESAVSVATGSTLSGTGTVAGTVSQAGEVAPGLNGSAVLTLGNCTQSSTARTSIEIGGTVAGVEFDQLSITGSASIDGSLDVSLTNGFVPSVDDQFLVLVAGSRSGSFSQVNLPTLPIDRAWTVSYDFLGTPSVTLGVESVSPFATWQVEEFGPDAANPTLAGPTADPDVDGIANLLEYALGLDPLIPLHQEGPLAEQPGVTQNPNGELFFDYRKNPTATDLVYTIMESDDLGENDPWTTATLAGDALLGMDGPIELRSATIPLPYGLRRFYRLEVELIQPE